MILGSYRNPPYKSHNHRSPKRDSPSVSPPPPPHAADVRDVSPNSPPKRKRIDDSLHESGLRIEVGKALDDDGVIMGSGKDSPRTKVAAKLKGLEIDERERKGVGKGESPRKRMKRMKGVSEANVAEREVVTPSQLRGVDDVEIPESAMNVMLEIGETPQISSESQHTPSSSPPSSPTDLQALRKAFGMTNTGQPTSPAIHKSKRMPSPPPPTPRAPPPPSTTPRISPFTFAPSLPNIDEAMLDLSSLTWQDNEITGHEIGSDDDGEGINGVGFRPTAQMAWMRSQKRKAQVEGWKNREAREARARRSERRRGAGGDRRSSEGNGGGVGKGRRAVRFEGEG